MQARPRILPPVYLLLTVALMIACHRFLPIMEIPGRMPGLLGMGLVLLGLVMILWPATQFGRLGTGVVPFSNATSLVTTGFYRFTRNPMYLGMLLMLLGGALKSGALGAFLPVPLFPWVIHRRYILREEVFLEDIFGEEYRAYRQRVRRWL